MTSSPSSVPSAPAATGSSPSPVRMPGLDALRGLAIMLVLVHNFSLAENGHSRIFKLWNVLPESGWIGVQLFFVLSGFLITGILVDDRGLPRFYKRFYVRRALRIFPLYYALPILYGLLYATGVLEFRIAPVSAYLPDLPAKLVGAVSRKDSARARPPLVAGCRGTVLPPVAFAHRQGFTAWQHHRLRRHHRRVFPGPRGHASRSLEFGLAVHIDAGAGGRPRHRCVVRAAAAVPRVETALHRRASLGGRRIRSRSRSVAARHARAQPVEPLMQVYGYTAVAVMAGVVTTRAALAGLRVPGWAEDAHPHRHTHVFRQVQLRNLCRPHAHQGRHDCPPRCGLAPAEHAASPLRRCDFIAAGTVASSRARRS